MLPNQLEGLLNTVFWSPAPDFMIQYVEGGAPELDFLISSQVMLMSLVQSFSRAKKDGLRGAAGLQSAFQ